VISPQVSYADGPDGRVVYSTLGDGPLDIVFNGSWGHNLDGIWEAPAAARFLRALASTGRLVLIDKRGSGASDPLVQMVGTKSYDGTIEDGARDLLCVLDHIGSTRAAIVATNAGTMSSMMLASTHPDRIVGLVLIDPLPTTKVEPGYDGGLPEEQRLAAREAVAALWGEGVSLGLVPSMVGDAEFTAWLARYERQSSPRSTVIAFYDALDYDLRPLARVVSAPTLVMHHATDFYPHAAAQWTADNMPNARGPVTIDCPDTEIFAPQPQEAIDEIVQFLHGLTEAGAGTAREQVDRAFAVLLFTDIVGSTEAAARMGDQSWVELLELHRTVAARQVAQFDGRLVEHIGDGLLATFGAPARAVRCASALAASARQLGVAVRAGVHAGEVDVRGGTVAGIAVHIASRVQAAAGADQVFVSRTVKDLVAGSGLTLVSQGEHDLKGVQEPWELFRVEA
jgi:class 3 adenylate cyclase/pimeloyl-ACP methyl ester carboxylesterase